MQAIRGTHFGNLTSAGQNLATNTVGVGMFTYVNKSGSTTFIHFYDALAASVTVGTTSPMFVVSLADSAYDWLEFSPPLLFSSACSVFALTAPEGSTASSTGVFVQAFVN